MLSFYNHINEPGECNSGFFYTKDPKQIDVELSQTAINDKSLLITKMKLNGDNMEVSLNEIM